MHPAPVLVPEKVSSPPKTASEHPDASEPGRRSWFSGLKQADDIDIYGTPMITLASPTSPSFLFLRIPDVTPEATRPALIHPQTTAQQA